LQLAEVNYSTFDLELLAANQAIKHFLHQVEGRVFQLWTDHKPLVTAMKRVTPLISGRQQRYLAFISAHPWRGQRGGGHPEPAHLPPHPPSPVFSNQIQVVDVAAAAAAVADANLSPLDIKEMVLQQILCPQVQKLLHQPGLKIGFKQVDDLKLWGDVSTGTFQPLVPLPHR
jgi:hypothetical protein